MVFHPKCINLINSTNTRIILRMNLRRNLLAWFSASNHCRTASNRCEVQNNSVHLEPSPISRWRWRKEWANGAASEASNCDQVSTRLRLSRRRPAEGGQLGAIHHWRHHRRVSGSVGGANPIVSHGVQYCHMWPVASPQSSVAQWSAIQRTRPAQVFTDV